MIDLRSDTVTQPTDAMRRAMAEADVGDDVYGEDPTVNRLQALVAERLGKEDALFVPSGTQSNLLAILSQCERGDEYIVGQTAHCYRYEGGGAAVLGSVQPQPLPMSDDGRISVDEIAGAIKVDDPHFARTRLVCLENTFGGRVLPFDYLAEAARLARDHGLSIHLDGARLFNAEVATGIPVADWAVHADTVTLAFSKGLGAPVGSVLCGPAEVIARARRWRKILGGGWRQAGILAAAALHALEHHVDRLEEDHSNAARLADGLAEITLCDVERGRVETNMVFARMRQRELEEAFVAFARERDVLVGGRGGFRFVTHLDVDADDIERFLAVVRQFEAEESS